MIRSLIRILGAVAVFSTALTYGASTPAPAAPPDAGTFTRVDATAMGGERSVYPVIVTDGRGTYHSVVRDDTGIGQFIRYSRSTDGGRTWTVAGLFAGPNGGATRPDLAVDGNFVAVAFIGSRCESLSLCTEVPMLVRSANGGRSWGSPQVLSEDWGSITAVAQDASRTWVAWERGGTTALRVFGTDTTPTLSAELTGTNPMLASRDGLVAISTVGWNGSEATSRFALARDGLVGPTRVLPGYPKGVAVADGRGHVVLEGDRRIVVGTIAETSGLNASPTTELLAAGRVSAPTIDARPGLLAVGWTERDPDPASAASRAYVVSSNDAGANYGAPTLVGADADGVVSTMVSIAERVARGPVARLDYTVADKYTDGPDSDNLPEPANSFGQTSFDAALVNAELEVTIDGCASTAAATRTIADDAYAWTIDGVDQPETACILARSLRPDESVEVTLEITDSAGDTATTALTVTAEDILMVSIGDSVASGEGNPHADGIYGPGTYTSETWQDGACHRSALAGPALAARQLEAADDRSAVTFIQLACSGAAIMDTPDTPGVPISGQDPDTGGLLDAYRGIEAAGAPVKRPQLDELDDINDRPVDVMTVSIGANDVRFSSIVKDCITTSPGTLIDGCHEASTKDTFDARLIDLPNRYAALDARFDAMGIEPDNVFITEYMDVTEDELGEANLRCIGDEALAAIGFVGSYIPVVGTAIDILVAAILAGGLVTDDEAAFAKNYVVTKLNDAVAAGASVNGWNLVDDIARRFARHGYCSDENWIVQVGESFISQFDENGAFHPNGQGQRVYGDALGAAIVQHRLDTLADTAANEPLGADRVGEVYALTSSNDRIVATALRDTGGALLVSGARTMVTADRTVDPSAYLYGSPVVGDTLSAVVAWHELWNSSTDVRVWNAPVAVVDNVTVLGARLVQAPSDSLMLLRDRPLLAVATVQANLGGPTQVNVRTVIEDDLGVLADATETVLLQPGLHDLVLPSATVTSGGSSAHASVSIAPVLGEPVNLRDDNVAETPDYTLVDGRKVSVTFVPASLAGGGGLSCADVADAASAYGDYAHDALPVTELDADIACTPTSPIGVTQDSLIGALLELDEYARLTGRDAAIAVVPSGWLQSVAGGAVGIAAPGVRAAIVERGKSPAVVAHELNHTFGFDHLAAPAVGVRVSNRTVISGTDFMAPTEVSRPWTGRATWEATQAQLGGPVNEPEPSLLTPDQVALRGRFVRQPDGSLVYQRGPSSPTSTGGTDPDLEDLELERLVIRQTDINGGATDTPVGLAPVEALQAAGAGDPVEQGLAFSVDLTLVPDLATIDVLFDGEVVDTLTAGSAPTVDVTAPTAGVVVGSQDDITVTWDTDSPDLTATLLLSPDGGVTWQPVASGVTGTSFTFPSPEDVDSDEVVVRVIVGDGVQFASADSDTFAVRAALVTSPARVAFVRIAPNPFVPPVPVEPGTPSSFGTPGAGISTMNPDGTDVRELVPYVLPAPFVASGPLRPAWNADGTVVGFDAATSATTRSSFLINADGTGLRRLTNDHTVCAVPSPDGTRVLVLAKSTIESAAVMRELDLASGAVVKDYALASYRIGDEALETCPRYSPDGRYILFRLHTSFREPRAAIIDTAQNGLLIYPLQGDQQREWSGITPGWSPDGSRFGSMSQVTAYGPSIVNFDSNRTYAGTIVLDTGYYPGSVGFVDNDTTYISTAYNPYEIGRYCTVDLSADNSDYRTPTCYFPDGSGVPVPSRGPLPDPAPSGVYTPDLYRGSADEQPGSGPVVIPPVVAPDADAGGPYSGVVGTLVDFDAGASAALTPDALVEWDLDGDGDFDDAAGVRPSVGFAEPGSFQVRVRITPPGSPAAVSAAVALDIAPLPATDPVAPDDPPAPPIAGPADVAMVAPQGETTPVLLVDIDGTPGRFLVDLAPTAGKVTVSVPAVADPLAPFGTGPDGTLLITPVPGFLGTVTVPVAAVPGSGEGTAVLTIEVTGNQSPLTGDDSLDVPTGVVSVIAPEALLANDSDPEQGGTPTARAVVALEAPTGLSLTGVTSGTNGEAWLGSDGQVYVQPRAAGAGSFTYVVVDPQGATTPGIVRFTALSSSPPTTSTPTTSTPATNGAPTTTVPIPAVTVPTVPAASVPPAAGTSPVTAPGGGLPATGGDVGHAGRVGALLLLIGVAVVALSRMRRRVPAE